VAPDTIQVRLHLRLIRVLAVVVDALDELVVAVRCTRSWSRCPHCGFACRRVHDVRRRRVRDLSVSGRPVTLVWHRRRFACDGCGDRHLEDHDEFEGRLTRRLARTVVADAKVMSVRAVARRHGLSWSAVMALVASWSVLVAAHRRSKRCRVLLVDETSMRRRHRYVTVLQNGETGEVLGMVAHRNEAALSGFLVEQGRRWCAGVDVVVTDGSKSYRAAVQAHLGHATHVLDRFHVVRWFAAGLTLVRRELQRRQPQGHVTPAFDPELFRSRFALLRRADTLDERQREELRKLFARHPRIEVGWKALQELYGLYLADDRAGALAALDRFCDLYDTGQIPEFHDVVDTFIAWSTEILAFHDEGAGRISNGRLEGTNNKLQVLRRVAHGFTNRSNFEARGILACPAVRGSPLPSSAALTP
jgi:transposase